MPELCVIDVPAGASLEDLLFEYGVEFPCGGTTSCGGCGIRVVEGDIPVTSEMRDVFSEEEIAAGWRLACKARANGRIVLEIGQWSAAVESPILSDDSRVVAKAGAGLAIAIDLGTTTLVAQLIDLATGEIHGVRTALNPQASHGADIMSRIEYDLRTPGVLTHSIRDALGAMVHDLAGGHRVTEVVLAGNTVMHHLFGGISVELLSHVPFTPENDDTLSFNAGDLGWHVNADCRVTFLPCLGGFVGSDILAGMVAVSVLDSPRQTALIDLGTNGEIVVCSQEGAVCASTAAGPAFEAGRISMGMRAAVGAIDRVAVRGGLLSCHVIGGTEPRGICGSGLVDAVAAGLEIGAIMSSGRLPSKQLRLCGDVRITQPDVRELQLAKGAIAAGFDILRGITRISEIHLAGAFGNYVSIQSADRIGLLDSSVRITPAGNTALRGLKKILALGARREEVIERYRTHTRHVPLASDSHFLEIFADNMAFPHAVRP